MTGYHEVRVFPISADEEHKPTRLPDGWKPFAAYYTLDGLNIVARKWHRLEAAA